MKTTRVFTPTRIVALAVIGMLVVGLGYLRFASGDSPVSVPAGAKAGDLTMHACTHATEAGALPADCGTLVVPENRSDPDSRLIALPVTRIHARSEQPGEPIFLLWGGPGLSNMDWPQASRYADDHDVVLVGYRGVDGSSVLDCPEVVSALGHSEDLLGEATARAFTEGLSSCARRLQAEGVDLDGYTIPQRVEDLEDARRALGYDRVNLISESAGTRTAMIYAWTYPDRIHRSVMIAVNPPGHFAWDPQVMDDQLQRYAELCSRDEECVTQTDDLAASMRRTAAEMPDRWLFLPIKQGNVRVGTFWGMHDTTMENAPLASPMSLHAWLAAADGDASGFWFQSFLADFFFPNPWVWGEAISFAMQDAQAVEAYYAAGGDPGSILGNPGTEFIWRGGRTTRAWPANPSSDVFIEAQPSEVETLLVGGTLDMTTPPVSATKELLPLLPNGHQVVLAEFGHSGDFWYEQQEAGNRLVNTFLETGRVDDSLYTHRSIDFTPEVTHTALAKGILGTMVAFALVTIFSVLWWMPRRVRKRGGFGPVSGALLRSVYPVVLGFGGWFLGVLIILTTGLDLPLNNELLAVLGVGVPIGLGVYLAWVHRDWPAGNKVAGFTGAMGGAIVGAWLGFHSTQDLLALVTTLVGAAVGANLILIILEISRVRSDRRVVPPSPVNPARERVGA
jgi:pimeloyl-ACP methyl ester carboxylesterase